MLDGLSANVRRALLLALPPELRGWWTAEEIAGMPGSWIEITQLDDAGPRYFLRGQVALS